jgi:putative intracellular protease/amidase
MLKKILLTIGVLVTIILASGYWLFSLIPSQNYDALKASKAINIPYITNGVTQHRGKILAVVTSAKTMGESGKKTGYELTELARAYWVFKANGFDVDIASPQGGEPPVVIDGDDMGIFDYAFLNDEEAQTKANNTLLIDDINADDYQAVYFVGGKGAMFDFPENSAIQHLIKTLYQNDKVVAAVCHGPAALVNVKLDNGEMLVANKKISSFTNDEELFLIPNASEIFPFLLQDKLTQQGAKVELGVTYLEQVSQDGKLLTGQNPWSVWPLAENIITALGYKPIPRILTPEEQSINLLMTYENNGYDSAKQSIDTNKISYLNTLIVMHGVVAFMKWEILKGLELLMLAQALKL